MGTLGEIITGRRSGKFTGAEEAGEIVRSPVCYSGKVKGEIIGHANSPFPRFIDLTITSRPRVFKP